MGTIKKVKAFKKAEGGLSVGAKARGEALMKASSQAGKGPSSDYAERQGPSKESKAAPNSFPKATPVSTNKASEESFGQAFARERKAGAKTFSYKGKSYTTARADDKKVETKPTPTPYSTHTQSDKDAAAKKATTSTGSPAFKSNFPNQASSVIAKAKSTPAAKKTAPTPPANRKGLPPAKCGTKISKKK